MQIQRRILCLPVLYFAHYSPDAVEDVAYNSPDVAEDVAYYLPHAVEDVAYFSSYRML